MPTPDKIYKPEEEEIAQQQRVAQYEEQILTPSALAARTLMKERARQQFATLSEKEIDQALDSLDELNKEGQKTEKKKSPSEIFNIRLGEIKGLLKGNLSVEGINSAYETGWAALDIYKNLSKAEQKSLSKDADNLADTLNWMEEAFPKYLKNRRVKKS